MATLSLVPVRPKYLVPNILAGDEGRSGHCSDTRHYMRILNGVINNSAYSQVEEIALTLGQTEVYEYVKGQGSRGDEMRFDLRPAREARGTVELKVDSSQGDCLMSETVITRKPEPAPRSWYGHRMLT